MRRFAWTRNQGANFPPVEIEVLVSPGDVIAVRRQDSIACLYLSSGQMLSLGPEFSMEDVCHRLGICYVREEDLDPDE